MNRLSYGIFLGLGLALIISATPVLAEETAAPKISIGKKGLQVESADGLFKFKIGGRLHADATMNIGDRAGNIPPSAMFPNGVNRKATNGVELRRARLIAKATVYKHWNWVGEVDFADDNTEIKDFTVNYDTKKGFVVLAGNQKQPYSLALEMSSNDLPFSERGIDTDLIVSVLDRAIGLRGELHGDKWYVAAGFYGDGVKPQKNNANEGWGSSAKIVLTPIRTDHSLIHLGFRGAVRHPRVNNESLRFRDETTHMSNYHVVDTGTIQNVREISLFGPEAAIAFGPFSVFGEYNRAHITRKNADTVRFESGHVGMALSLTGESRAASYTIKTGEFKRLKPTGRFGAVEIATRYAYINLNDGGANGSGVNGGKEHAISTALNWYPNEVVRFTLNWTHVIDTDAPNLNANRSAFNRGAKGLDALTFRTQFNF